MVDVGSVQIVANAAIIEDNRILIFEKKGSWILPGGKPRNGESDDQCIRREYAEENSGHSLWTSPGVFYEEFSGVSPHSKRPTTARVYLYRRLGREPVTVSAEITSSAWMSYPDVDSFNLSDISRQIVDSLHRDRYI